SQLVKGVFETLSARHPEHEFVAYVTPFSRGLLRAAGANVSFVTLPFAAQAFGDGMADHAGRTHLDVLFRCSPDARRLAFPQPSRVALLCDLHHEDHPESFTAEELRERHAAFTLVVGGSGAIATVSECFRQKILARDCCHCRDVFVLDPAAGPVPGADAAAVLMAALERVAR